MAWSLQVKNGDFTVGGASLGIVTAEQKLVQDLSHFLLERMGTDTLHPGYGSLIDGGITPDGGINTGVIGAELFNEAALFVESDIRRICAEYQQRQIDRAQQDRFRYNKTTFTAGELLIEVDQIELVQSGPTLQVNISLITGANRSVFLSLPLAQQALFKGI